MTREEMREFELSLFEFVKRAAGEGATAEEVKALPAVTWALVKLEFPQSCSSVWA